MTSSYFPEKFSAEEKKYLRPFFSNWDKQVFVVQHLPEEVIGALSSRYSRTVHSLRRLFINEYVNPIIYPEKQKSWGETNSKDRKEAGKTRDKFKEIVDFLNRTGGVDMVVNIQRARKFFDTWLAQYGDDSIAEMGGVHVSLEGISNIAGEEIINKRIGISPLAKSSRYVSYADKRADGHFQYVVPEEVQGTKLETEYRRAMDGLFEAYSGQAEPYLEYIKREFPKGEDETEASFGNTRSAKRWDDLRDLLPFATQTNIALFGNGRAFEDVINRLMAHPLTELRQLGGDLCEELEKVVPSFVRRPKTDRGREIQDYRSRVGGLKMSLSGKYLTPRKVKARLPERRIILLDYSQDAAQSIIARFLFEGGGLSLEDIVKAVKKWPRKRVAEVLGKILAVRKMGKTEAGREEVRFRKVPRAFENAYYDFEVWARGGDFRDLHRHRQNTEGHQVFTAAWGYELEEEAAKSPFVKVIRERLEEAGRLAEKLGRISPYVAAYAVPFAYLQHWYWRLTAREIYWMVELRTSPQGRSHYRHICQEIARQVTKVCPEVFSGLMTDWNEYKLSRREAEKKIEVKLAALKNGPKSKRFN